VSTAGATEVGRLGREIESALYFTCLEALTNASKHAPTARVRVVLSRENGRVILEVADDGPGFRLAASERSHGLMNMSDRIAAIGGHIDVETLPGVGTLVRATIPTGDD
jgi:signal transduction histidine kinase